MLEVLNEVVPYMSGLFYQKTCSLFQDLFFGKQFWLSKNIIPAGKKNSKIYFKENNDGNSSQSIKNAPQVSRVCRFSRDTGRKGAPVKSFRKMDAAIRRCCWFDLSAKS